MEAFVEALYQKPILDHMIHAYGLDPNVRLISASESYVYEAMQNEEVVILRVTHQSHRTKTQLFGEVTWLSVLREYGLSISKVLPGIGREPLVECGSEDGSFYGTLMSRAPGRPVTQADWEPALYREWGRVLGQMHRAAAEVDLKETGLSDSRPNWVDEYNVCAGERVIENPNVHAKQQKWLKTLQALPKDRRTFGLVHGDLEDENFFITDGGQITPFDFDECQHHFFVYDIASILRQTSWQLKTLDDRKTFLHHFLEGYTKSWHLSAFWFEKIPLFLLWREICMYVYLQGKRLHTMGAQERLGLLQMEARILEERPAIDLDKLA